MIAVKGYYFDLLENYSEPLSNDSDFMRFDFLNTENHNESTWYLGLDQSSSCTGIRFRTNDERYQLIFELENRGSSKKDFYFKLQQFVARLVRGKKVLLFIIEKPVPSKYRTGGSVLEALRGVIETVWTREIAELSKCKLDGIFPQEWKSQVMDKSKGKNRSKNKECIAEDICDRWPHLKQFYPMSRSGKNGHDGYDAVGVLEGYLLKNIDESGHLKVTGSKDLKTTKLLAFMKYVPVEKFQADKMLGVGDVIGSKYSPVFKVYDKTASVYENVVMCSTGTLTQDSNCSITVVTEPLGLLALLWEMKMDFKPGHALVLFVMKKSVISKSFIEYMEVCGFNSALFV